MQPTRDIETYLAHVAPNLNPELRDIIFELRDMLAAIAPAATEAIHRTGFSYFHGERGGPVSAGICQINLHGDHIRLAFNHGAFLPDPHGLLEGERLYKRYVRLYSFDQTPWAEVQELITAAAHFDPRVDLSALA